MKTKPKFGDLFKSNKADGKKAKAPCGHDGTHVSPNVILCDIGCDNVPKPIDPKSEITKPWPTICLHNVTIDDGTYEWCADCNMKINNSDAWDPWTI